MRKVIASLFGLFLHATFAGAQQVHPVNGGTTTSLGQPKTWKWSAGAGLGWAQASAGTRGVATAHLGMFHDVINPVIGIGGLNIEGYIGARDTRSNGGVRARIASPALRLGVGADYNFIDHDIRPLISLYGPFRRGGFFNNGSELRLDVLLGSNPQYSMSLEVPIFRRIPTGKTRPRHDHVALSSRTSVPVRVPANTAKIQEPLVNARTAAALIRRLNVPFLDETSSNRQRDEAMAVARIRDLATAIPTDGDSVRAIEVYVRRFHAEVERAFALAMSNDNANTNTPLTSATVVAAKARSILLDEVLFPYNRLLGQTKDDDTTEEFAKRARGAFMRWLLAESGGSSESIDAAAWVFSTVLDIVEANRAALRHDWRDSRFVWLPLQYGLTPEQHDAQAELDALIERGVHANFTQGNAISYVINEQFQRQLQRTIHAAKDYHVLWIHDFRGYDAQGEPDQQSYDHVLNSYLSALTRRVREYDRTGRMPVYMIMLDEFFYQANHASLWMNLLEDPTRYQLRLPRKYASWERTIRVAQDSLRKAILHSKLLQAQREQHGEAWLRELVKVHVSITNASDPSFWSFRVAPPMPLFDNLIRDHRKLVFYDVTEVDPNVGEALYTGAGIGEHYASAAWEDRALLVSGPVLVGLKTAARSALLQQGMPSNRIPLALQPKEKALDYEARVLGTVTADRRRMRALTIANETGFDSKQINVAKAVLYTLMPPGSVIKIPDSLWNSAFWGSALVGCALRGVRVVIVGPALTNAPANSFGSMIRSQELFWRLLTVARELGPQIARAGGLLKVGVFVSDIPVTDLAGKARSVNAVFAEHEWLRQLFDFPPSVYESMNRLPDEIQSAMTSQPVVSPFESDDRPKLHLKANFFASREAWGLMSRPELAAIARDFATQRLEQTRVSSVTFGDDTLVPLPVLDVGSATIDDWFSHLTPEVRERVVFYTIMGSQNQNARSMVEDGEDAIVVSAWPSMIPFLDFITLVGQSRWLEDPADLAVLLPPQSGIKRRVAHWLRLVF